VPDLQKRFIMAASQLFGVSIHRYLTILVSFVLRPFRLRMSEKIPVEREPNSSKIWMRPFLNLFIRSPSASVSVAVMKPPNGLIIAPSSPEQSSIVYHFII
jgi:hypothetical protein